MIRITRPELGAAELKAIHSVLDTGHLSQGKHVARFEERLAEAAGSPHAVALSSGTAALHLALLAAGVGPGDEVITSAFTFPATVNVIELVGARPVLVDIELSTFNMDVSLLQGAITGKTRAIMPVHEFGLMADMAAIRRVARERGLIVIEDAACALGARQGALLAGAAGDVGCFSFHPRKSITTGEGGCATTAVPKLAGRIRALRSHGMELVDGELDLVAPGLNYRMSELEAAMGLAQLDRFAGALARRRLLARRYDERLASCDWLSLPREPQGWTHSWQSYVVGLPEDLDRTRVIASLRDSGVEAVRGAYAVHRLSYYAKRYAWRPHDFPSASAAHDRALALPLYAGLPEDAVDRVVDCLGGVRS